MVLQVIWLHPKLNKDENHKKKKHSIFHIRTNCGKSLFIRKIFNTKLNEWRKCVNVFDVFCYLLDSIASIEAQLGHIFCNNQVVFTKEINSIIPRKLSKVVLLMFFFSWIDFSTSRCKILQSFVIIDFFILRQKNKSNLINAPMIYCGIVA